MLNQFTHLVPFGCQYHRAPTPLPEEWEDDLAEIKRQGYTHVQFRPQWRWHERIRGKAQWDDLDRLMDLALANRLHVVLKPQLETAPDWVFTELGGTRMGFHGQSLDPISHAAFYVGGWWPCFDNPAVAEAAVTFTRMVAQRYKDHPALWFYNAWNEPRSRPLGQCTCPHSIKKYRDYLKRRFATIEELNDTYGKAWTSFDTIMPPQSYSDYTELFLWRSWAAESVADQIALSVRGLREGDPQAKIMCHVGCSSVVQDPACDTSDDLLNACKVDWYGCSFPIELRPVNLKQHNTPLYQSAWMRRVCPDWWCHEFYTNNANWIQPPKPAVIEQAIWMALASGAKGLTFWQYRSERFGEESNGWGMREIDGTPTERSKICDHIAHCLSDFGKDFQASSPRPAGAAIWFKKSNDLLMRIQAMQTSPNAIQEVQDTAQYSYKFAIEGAHILLRRLGITADFVVSQDDVSAYRLLVVTATELVTPEEARWLSDFVQQGGTLLVEFPFACRDHRTWVTAKRPSNHLERLLGCTEGERTVFSAQDGECVCHVTGETEHLDGWKVSLVPLSDDVHILAHWQDGEVAALMRPFGKGCVFVSGGNAAIHAGKSSGLPELSKLYRMAYEHAGLPLGEQTLWKVSRFSPHYHYQFIFNLGDAATVTAPPHGILYSSDHCVRQADRVILPHLAVLILKLPLSCEKSGN